MSFRPHWFVIHNTGSADRVGAFDANNIRHILFERKLGGYHVIDEMIDGVYWPSILNRLDRAAEHVAHHNSEAVGWSFIGDFNATSPAPEMLAQAAPHVAALLHRFDLGPDALIAHRDVPQNDTDCPGTLFTKDVFEKFRTIVAEQWMATE